MTPSTAASVRGERRKENAKSQLQVSGFSCPDPIVNLQDWVSIHNQDLERIFIATLKWSSGRMQAIQSTRFRVRALHGRPEIRRCFLKEKSMILN